MGQEHLINDAHEDSGDVHEEAADAVQEEMHEDVAETVSEAVADPAPADPVHVEEPVAPAQAPAPEPSFDERLVAARGEFDTSRIERAATINSDNDAATKVSEAELKLQQARQKKSTCATAVITANQREVDASQVLEQLHRSHRESLSSSSSG